MAGRIDIAVQSVQAFGPAASAKLMLSSPITVRRATAPSSTEAAFRVWQGARRRRHRR